MITIDIPYKMTMTPMRCHGRNTFKLNLMMPSNSLEKVTGKVCLEEKFKEVCEISQRTERAWLKAAEYCQYGAVSNEWF